MSYIFILILHIYQWPKYVVHIYSYITYLSMATQRCSFPEYAREQRIYIQPRPSRVSRKMRQKRGKGLFASLSKQRTGLQ